MQAVAIVLCGLFGIMVIASVTMLYIVEKVSQK